jgi:hypothetical protein
MTTSFSPSSTTSFGAGDEAGELQRVSMRVGVRARLPLALARGTAAVVAKPRVQQARTELTGQETRATKLIGTRNLRRASTLNY